MEVGGSRSPPAGPDGTGGSVHLRAGEAPDVECLAEIGLDVVAAWVVVVASEEAGAVDDVLLGGSGCCKESIDDGSVGGVEGVALGLRWLFDVVVEHGGVCCGLRIVREGTRRASREGAAAGGAGMTGYAEG